MEKGKRKQLKITKGTLAMLTVLAVFVILLLLMVILRTNQAICEFVCRHFVSIYQAAAGRFFSVTRVNIFEILVTLAILFAVGCIACAIALFCKGKKVASRRVMLALLLVCFGIANLYTFTAGFAYNRDIAPIETYQGEIDRQTALDCYIALVDDLNDSYAEIGRYNDDGSVVCPYTAKQLDEKIREAVDGILTDGFYYGYTPKAKPIVSSGVMTLNSIAGITFLPTCEPGYNKDMPIVDVVHTIAHEFAHSKGVMREYEANIVGAYVLLNSGDAFLKYCGYIYAVGYMQELVKYDETYFATLNEYPIVDGFWQDKRNIYYWWAEQPRLGDIGEFFNDLYLKVNGQQEGTDSYEQEPDTEEIVIGGGDCGEEEIYLEVITRYTDIHRMLVRYAGKLK